jgi:uncharacterized membrane protein YdjX (TVP38/TMEM64 family)
MQPKTSNEVVLAAIPAAILGGLGAFFLGPRAGFAGAMFGAAAGLFLAAQLEKKQ